MSLLSSCRVSCRYWNPRQWWMGTEPTGLAVLQRLESRKRRIETVAHAFETWVPAPNLLKEPSDRSPARLSPLQHSASPVLNASELQEATTYFPLFGGTYEGQTTFNSTAM